MIALFARAICCTTGARADGWDMFATYYNNVAKAAAANDAGAVTRLVAGGGYKADSVDDSGRTGLQIAAISGNLQIAAILIKAGANVNRKDGLGNTALHVAIERNQTEMADLLIDIGADVNSENRNGMTPLMIAARQGNTVLVRKLIEKGADVRKTDFTGRDAVNWAQENRHSAVVQLLQQRAAARRTALTRLSMRRGSAGLLRLRDQKQHRHAAQQRDADRKETSRIGHHSGLVSYDK